jgi:pimeloyl-ACP methyl ester carboxylesterase
MPSARCLFAALLAPAFASPTLAAPAQPDGVYKAPQQLVAVDGGRRLNLYCAGAGDPTVILEAGSGNSMVTWRFVQGAVAGATRVCAYDRAGLGFSDAAARPADVRNLADDLRRLVEAAGITRPYVLVGHSLGGEIAVYAAATAPKDVAGMVLVDPAFADQTDSLEAGLAPDNRKAIRDAMARALAFKRTCLDAARAGNLDEPDSPAERACVNTKHDPNKLDHTLSADRRKQLTEPKVWEAGIAELAAFAPDGDHPDTDSSELDSVPFDMGDKPLIVLSRGVGEGAPGAPPADLPRVEAAWIAGHAALAAHSRRGAQIVVAGARHYIQIDRPQAVVDAVLKVVGEVRDGRQAQQK